METVIEKVRAMKKALKTNDVVRRRVYWYVRSSGEKNLCCYTTKLDADGVEDRRPILLSNYIDIINKYPEILDNKKIFYANIKITNDSFETYYNAIAILDSISNNALDTSTNGEISINNISESEQKESGLFAKVNNKRITYVNRIVTDNGNVEYSVSIAMMGKKANVPENYIKRMLEVQKEEIALYEKIASSSFL